MSVVVGVLVIFVSMAPLVHVALVPGTMEARAADPSACSVGLCDDAWFRAKCLRTCAAQTGRDCESSSCCPCSDACMCTHAHTHIHARSRPRMHTCARGGPDRQPTCSRDNNCTARTQSAVNPEAHSLRSSACEQVDHFAFYSFSFHANAAHGILASWPCCSCMPCELTVVSCSGLCLCNDSGIGSRRWLGRSGVS